MLVWCVCFVLGFWEVFFRVVGVVRILFQGVPLVFLFWIYKLNQMTRIMTRNLILKRNINIIEQGVNTERSARR